MPWQEVSVMRQRREFVTLALQEGANRRELCRRFGISPQTGYKWLHRWQNDCRDLTDRSRRPHASPHHLAPDREAAILAVRDAHPRWGARKIAAVLAKAGQTPGALSTIHAVLCRHGRIVPRPGGPPARHRFEMPAPNMMWQMDFKGWFKLADGRHCHPLLIVDDHARFLLCLRACSDQQYDTVQAALIATFRRYGMPERIFVDNGSPWGGSLRERWTRMRVWLLKLGVRLIHGRAHHPQGRGKIERLNGTLQAEVLSLRRFADPAAVQPVFDRWRDVYNLERPHEALAMQVPADRYQPSPRRMPDQPASPSYLPGEIVRRVGTTRAYVRFKGKLWPVGQAFRGEPVALRPRGAIGHYDICFGAYRVGQIDLTQDTPVNDVSEQVSTMSPG